MSRQWQTKAKTGSVASFTPTRSGECAACGKEQQTARGFGFSHRESQDGINDVPSIVRQALGSPGQPLDDATRALMESRFGHDFSQVRVHVDANAADSARALSASAYTVNKELVFQDGQYQPDTKAGKRLLAHELAHVVQQGHSAPGSARGDLSTRLALSQTDDPAEREAVGMAEAITNEGRVAPRVKIASESAGLLVHRQEDDWNKVYGQHKSFLQKPYEEFKAGLGEIKATTEGGLTENKGRPIKAQKGAGTPAAPEITFEVLKEIYPGLGADVAADPAKEEKAKKYVEHLNQAFKVMKIDTVEAQSVYLAHAFIESDQFRQFTETQGWMDAAGKGTQKWEDNPEKLKLDLKTLNDTYNKTDTPEARERKRTVNPYGNFEFIGRGPVQVTHQPEYVEVIAMLEKTAEQYDKEAIAGNKQAKDYAELARNASKDLKADPRKAADPQYTFLVSAAFMKKRGADVTAAQVKTGVPWTGADAASGWVAGGKQKKGSPQAKALVDKANAFDKIYPVLLREAKKKNPAAQAQYASAG